MNLNKVFLMGHVTRDLEIRYTPSGIAVATMGLAVNEKRTKDGETIEEVTFVDCTLWGKTAENCAEYLSKGSPVMVEGKLKYSTWEDKQSGAKRSKIDVTAISVQFLGGKGAGGKSQQEQPPADDDGIGNLPDDDVPF